MVRRVLSSCGRTRAFVNGQLATQQVLARITHGLTDISSQHEHHTLTDPSTHLGYLDAFAGACALRQRVARAYHALKQAQRPRRGFRDARGRPEARELLKSQVDDIEDAAPEPGRRRGARAERARACAAWRVAAA